MDVEKVLNKAEDNLIKLHRYLDDIDKLPEELQEPMIDICRKFLRITQDTLHGLQNIDDKPM